MKIRLVIFALILISSLATAQEKTKISVFPFLNKNERADDWLTYGLSYLITESISNSGIFESVPQEMVYKAVSDPDIHLLSAMEGRPDPSLTKYSSGWNAQVFIVGNFSAASDSITVHLRICDLTQSLCGSPVVVKGGYRDYRSFYFFASNMMGSVYSELKRISPAITEKAVSSSLDKTRQLCADYDGYKTFIKSWMALRNYENGLSAVESEDLDGAIKLFETARSLDEGNILSIPANLSKAYVLRGNAFFAQSKLDEAGQDYASATVIQPENSDAYYNLGNVYKAKNDFDNAIVNYGRSLELDPAKYEACINTGYIYLSQGNFSDAITSYGKALSIRPSDANTHYYLGVAYDNKGLTDSAISHYRRAVEINPSLAGAHLNLGILLKQQKDLAGARKAYEAAVASDPGNALAHRNLGILLMNDKNEYASAAEHLQKSLDLDPAQDDAAVIKKNIGILKKKSGKKKK